MNQLEDLQKIMEEALNCGDLDKCKNQLAALAILEDSIPRMNGIQKPKSCKDGVVEISEENYYSFIYYSCLNGYLMGTSEAYRNSHYAEKNIKAAKRLIADTTPELMERFLKEYTKEGEK